ncbi:heterokaryon incompatibility protein-domain-containing protein [Nemania sp. FL0031]|nr:heterokaryon incompatibility protein-domain-containing protein [Nemania sp. FL0031]
MSSAFVYSRLLEHDHIRLLLLQPAASRDNDLVGSLQHISLSSHYHDVIEPYTALSYVWGEPTSADKIRLDDKELGITANLGAALRGLRDADRTHRIWADALCIDQNNIPERNQQVALMGQIYSLANNTVIYFGPLTSCAEIILQEVNRAILLEIAGPRAANCSSDEDMILDAAKQSVLAQPWFSRVWVFQELVLSRQPWVQFGSRRIRWQDLCRLLIPFLNKTRGFWDAKKNLTILENMDNIRTEYWKGHSSSLYSEPSTRNGGDLGDHDDGRGSGPRRLWRLLDMRKDCGATDPRDFIFAHMGIVSDREAAFKYITIDYTQTTSEVFTSAARYIGRRGGFLSLRTAVSPSGTADSILPSWVPSWNRQISQKVSERDIEASLSTPFANSSRAEAFPMCAAAKVMYVSGVMPPSSVPPEKFRELLKDYCQKLVNNGYRDGSWKNFVDKLTGVGGVESSAFGGAPLQSWPDHVKNQGGPALEHQINGFFSVYLYSKLWDTPPFESRLALLNNGIIVIVPRETLSGDVLVHLAWQNEKEYGLLDMTGGYSAVKVVVVRRHSPLGILNFEHEYVSNYVTAMLKRDNIRDSGLNEILFLHGILIGSCWIEGVTVPELAKNARGKQAVEWVDGWSVHNVAERLGRRRDNGDELSPDHSCVIVLH